MKNMGRREEDAILRWGLENLKERKGRLAFEKGTHSLCHLMLVIWLPGHSNKAHAGGPAIRRAYQTKARSWASHCSTSSCLSHICITSFLLSPSDNCTQFSTGGVTVSPQVPLQVQLTPDPGWSHDPSPINSCGQWLAHGWAHDYTRPVRTNEAPFNLSGPSRRKSSPPLGLKLTGFDSWQLSCHHVQKGCLKIKPIQ
jgi:hypothetical protein